MIIDKYFGGVVLMVQQKIKLIEIIADSSLGGGPRHVLGLIKHIDKNLFDVYVICPSGYLSAEAKQINGVTVINVAMRSKFDLVSLWQIKQAINKIRAEKDPFGPLIVHTHGSRAGFLGRIAAPLKAKRVYTEHRFDADYHLKNQINEWLQRKILSAQNHRSQLIIAVSNSVKDFLVRNNFAPEEKIRVIPNAINLTNEKPKHIIAKNLTAPIIGNIANLNYQKGQIYLINAMPIILKKYPMATLEIIGEGDERKILESEIKKLRLQKHISLLGNKNKVEKYLQHWTVFVLPSIAETFGIVLLEAMAYGLPIVATKVGGIPDVIIHKKNGLLVEPKNEKALAKAILEVLDHPPLAAKFKREGFSRVKNFDWKEIIKKLEQEFIELFNS